MNQVKVGNKVIGSNHPTYLIAEIGINHNGEIEIARKLMELAKDFGFDAVKFQKRTIEVVYSREELERPRESVFGKTNGDLKKGLEFDENDFKLLDEEAKRLGIHWFASPWDLESVDFLERYDVVAHKIASACLTDSSLLKRVRATGKPVFLSTGMSTLQQVRKAISHLDVSNLILMHTVSTYPAKLENLNLTWISELQTNFPEVPVGYSGHEVGVLPSVVAVAKYGAVCLERHVTLDRSLWGTDQSASLEPAGMERVARYIREIPLVCGQGKKHMLPDEVPIAEKLRRVRDF
jgi:N-acetylneuraminate synthase